MTRILILLPLFVASISSYSASRPVEAKRNLIAKQVYPIESEMMRKRDYKNFVKFLKTKHGVDKDGENLDEAKALLLNDPSLYEPRNFKFFAAVYAKFHKDINEGVYPDSVNGYILMHSSPKSLAKILALKPPIRLGKYNGNAPLDALEGVPNAKEKALILKRHGYGK